MSQPEFRMPDRCFVTTDAVSPHEYRVLQRALLLVQRRHEVSALEIPRAVGQASHRMRLELREAALERANRGTAAHTARRGGWA